MAGEYQPLGSFGIEDRLAVVRRLHKGFPFLLEAGFAVLAETQAAGEEREVGFGDDGWDGGARAAAAADGPSGQLRGVHELVDPFLVLERRALLAELNDRHLRLYLLEVFASIRKLVVRLWRFLLQGAQLAGSAGVVVEVARDCDEAMAHEVDREGERITVRERDNKTFEGYKVEAIGDEEVDEPGQAQSEYC